MWGAELVLPNKNKKFLKILLYFKPRITVRIYLQLTASFTSKIYLHKFTRIMMS